MNAWKDFHDLTAGSEFCYFGEGDELFLTHEATGILRPGAEQYITRYESCARRFLQMLVEGSLDIHSQQRIVKILLDIDQLCDANVKQLATLKNELIATLISLSTRIDEILLERGASLALEKFHLEHVSGLGNGQCRVNYGVGVARTVALKTFIKQLCEKLLGSTTPSDLCGDWSLIITEPQYPEFAEVFAGIYGGPAEATITKCSDAAVWTLRFNHFPPMRNWYSLEAAAYQAAAPIVAETLLATVVARGDLSN